jgi:membrane protein DedA with SNARE-associated domain
MPMNDTIQFVARHGYVLLFCWLLAEQAALPIPSIPLLLVSGALTRTGQLQLSWVLIYALAACLIADNAWYQVGRCYGAQALRFVCAMSLEPDSCVRRTENVLIKYGLRTLLISKFIPGLSVVATPLAGGSDASFSRFLLFDSLGALIWIASYVFVGYLFSDQVELAIGYALRMGSGIVVVALGVFIIWIAWKFVQRRRFVKSINVARISAEELMATLDAGANVTIVDVRSNLIRDVDSVPGTLRIPIEDLAGRHEEIPRDREIILFCT